MRQCDDTFSCLLWETLERGLRPVWCVCVCVCVVLEGVVKSMGVFKASFYPLLKTVLKLITKIHVYCERLEVQSAALRWVAEGTAQFPPAVFAQLQGRPSKLPYPTGCRFLWAHRMSGVPGRPEAVARPGYSVPQNPTWNLHAYRSGLCGLVGR